VSFEEQFRSLNAKLLSAEERFGSIGPRSRSRSFSLLRFVWLIGGVAGAGSSASRTLPRPPPLPLSRMMATHCPQLAARLQYGLLSPCRRQPHADSCPHLSLCSSLLLTPTLRRFPRRSTTSWRRRRQGSRKSSGSLSFSTRRSSARCAPVFFPLPLYLISLYPKTHEWWLW
jgi:hypothetical protein